MNKLVKYKKENFKKYSRQNQYKKFLKYYLKMRKICVIGLGHIGLPTAIIFATHGYSVVGVDINPEVVKSLKYGKIHIELQP